MEEKNKIGYEKLILFFLALLFLAFLFSASRYNNRSFYLGKKIVAFGDSLTAGIGADGGKNYPFYLAESLGSSVVNLGVSGDTTIKAMSRINSVYDEKPDVVIVILGGNDVLDGITMEITENNLIKMITDFKERGIKVVLAGLDQNRLMNYERMFSRVATKTGVDAYVPNILSGLAEQPELLSDPKHPNSDGYKIIADRLEPFVKKALTSF